VHGSSVLRIHINVKSQTLKVHYFQNNALGKKNVTVSKSALNNAFFLNNFEICEGS